MKKKFNEGGQWKVESKLDSPDDILAYSFLEKNIEFNYAFENIKDGINYNGVNVKVFGINESNGEAREKLQQQVKILNYKNDENFIISLKGKNEDDEIVLAKIPPQDSLSSTLNYALENSSGEQEMSSRDILKVPILKFNINKQYKELEGKDILNKGFTDYTLASALQRIQFSLTEKGAELKSKAEMYIALGESIQSNAPKNLVFNKPFLLYMKEKGDNKPYFAMWVDNSDVMMKN